MTVRPLLLQRLHWQPCRCCLSFAASAPTDCRRCSRCSTISSPYSQRCPVCGYRYGRGRLLSRWQERVRSRLLRRR